MYDAGNSGNSNLGFLSCSKDRSNCNRYIQFFISTCIVKHDQKNHAAELFKLSRYPLELSFKYIHIVGYYIFA